jgi:hypothetical protein
MNEKMKHPSPNELQAYLDGELEVRVSELVSEHLINCTSCQKELSRLDSLVTRLEALEEFTFEIDLSSRVLATIKHQDEVPRGLTWTLLAEGIAAGVVIGLLIPAIRSGFWIPRLIDAQGEVRAGVNIFLTQLASSWMFWWAQIQFDLSQMMNQISGQLTLSRIWPSPWILILSGAGVGLMLNFFLLRNSVEARNGQYKE